jgi:hypothetical protein
MIPRRQYSPLAIDVGGGAYAGQNGSPNPPWGPPPYGTTAFTNSIQDYAGRFRQASDDGTPYGFMFFYGLNPSSELLATTPSGAGNVRNRTKEEYISILTREVFGQSVLLTQEGGDFRKDW